MIRSKTYHLPKPTNSFFTFTFTKTHTPSLLLLTPKPAHLTLKYPLTTFFILDFYGTDSFYFPIHRHQTLRSYEITLIGESLSKVLKCVLSFAKSFITFNSF